MAARTAVLAGALEAERAGKIFCQDDFDQRDLLSGRHEIARKSHRKRIAALAVAELLQQGATQALETADLLALNQHGISRHRSRRYDAIRFY